MPPWFYILRPNVHGLMFDFMIAAGLQGDCGLRLEVLEASFPLAPDWGRIRDSPLIADPDWAVAALDAGDCLVSDLVLYSLAQRSRIGEGFRDCTRIA